MRARRTRFLRARIKTNVHPMSPSKCHLIGGPLGYAGSADMDVRLAMVGPPKEPSLRRRAGGLGATLVVVLALAPAAAQAASLQLPARVEATVEQGGSAQFTIPVSAGGAFTCATTATVQFDSVYSLSSAGDLTTSD